MMHQETFDKELETNEVFRKYVAECGDFVQIYGNWYQTIQNGLSVQWKPIGGGISLYNHNQLFKNVNGAVYIHENKNSSTFPEGLACHVIKTTLSGAYVISNAVWLTLKKHGLENTINADDSMFFLWEQLRQGKSLG